MADIFSKEKRSLVMSAVKGKGSKIEHEVGLLLRSSGIRFRSHSKNLPGKPDLYSVKYKVAVFVDSCFWHGCRFHGSLPKSNTAFWKKKLKRNKERDGEVNAMYRSMGWIVMRVWEHSLGTKRGMCRIARKLEEMKKMI